MQDTDPKVFLTNALNNAHFVRRIRNKTFKEQIKMENPLKDRVQYLISLCGQVLSTRRSTQYSSDVVDGRILHKYRSAGLSFISQFYGEKHSYYTEFHSKGSDYAPTIEDSLGVLEAIADEIDKGWHKSIRGVVSAELFSDFIEMANHLLGEGYKDAAAVMLGSTLEEHLRQLARNNGIEVEIESNGKMSPKKADVLNADLVKAGVYSKLDQKNVTAWLGLRNDAAHGKYDNYSKEQVVFFSQALNDFMARSEDQL